MTIFLLATLILAQAPGPVTVDRSRPRSRILGLDPNARAGTGPNSWPLR